MPRPTEQGLIGVHDTQGFTPGSPPNTQLQVVAPLDVDAAPQQAQALAKALGHGDDIAQQWLGKEAREQGANDEAEGEAAASLGYVSPADSGAPNATAHGFAVGFSKVQTQQTAFRASQAAQSFAAQNPTMPLDQYTDEQGNTQPGLLRSIDDIFKQHFPGGVEKDPEAARAMAPILTHTINEIAGQRNLQVIKDAQEQAEDLATSKLSYDIQHGTQFFNRDEALSDLQKVYGNDHRGALSALVHAVGEGSVTGADPSVVRQLLPKDADFGGGVRLTPQDQMYLDNAQARATEAQQRNQGMVAKQSMDNMTLMALNGKDVLPGLKQYLTLPGANGEQARALYDWVYKKGKEAEADSEENNKVGWDLMEHVNSGEITNGGQAMAFLRDQGLAGTKVGNTILQKAMSEVRNVQNINQDDPDYRSNRQLIADIYRPATGPLGKLMNPAAAAQQAGALSDYSTEYQTAVRQGKSSTDAARAARASVMQKWGDAIEGPSGMANPNQKLPTTDVDRAAVIQGLRSGGAGGLRSFHSSGINAADVKQLTDMGMISVDDGELAMRLILSQHTR